ncbi:MAG: DUF3078 domain-containing protein [Bacteroidales bacterium]|nr:DUF3078 domain-containing protein [Bacteroidales bacterium]
MKRRILLFLIVSLVCATIVHAQVVDNPDSLAKQTIELTKKVTEVTKSATGLADDLSSKKIETTEGETPKYWKISGIISFNMSATGLWNWAAGGNNNVNGVIAGNATLLYKKNKWAWESNFDSDFGLSWLDQTTYAWRKSNDKINFSTKVGYEFANKWYLTALAGFRSQYAKGFEYVTTDGVENKNYISKWLSPSYTDISVGVDWKPNSIFSLYLSPAAGRITTSTDSLFREKYLGTEYATKFPDRAYKAEFGATFKARVNYDLIKNFKVLSSLTLFTPYNENFGNVDVDWDVNVSYQFLKVLNVSLGTNFKYYDSVLITDRNGENPRPRAQFKAVLGFGLGYSF